MNGWVVIIFWEGIDSDSTAMKLETENGFLQPKMDYDYESRSAFCFFQMWFVIEIKSLVGDGGNSEENQVVE